MTNFPSIVPLVNKLTAMTPTAQTAGSNTLPGTLTLRTGVMLAINAGAAQNMVITGGTVVGDPNGNFWGPSVPTSIYVPANNVVVCIGPTWFATPWLGTLDTTVVLPSKVGVFGQPPNAWAMQISALPVPVIPTFQTSQTYSVSGTLAVASGATNYLPPFFVPVEAGREVDMFGVVGMVRSGSAVIAIQKNGSTLGSISVSTTPSLLLLSGSPIVSSLDYFAPVISSVSSADGLSLSFLFTMYVS